MVRSIKGVQIIVSMDQVDEGTMKYNTKRKLVPRNCPFDWNNYLCGGHFPIEWIFLSRIVMVAWQNAMSPFFVGHASNHCFWGSWTDLLLVTDYSQASPSMVHAYARLPLKKIAHQSYRISRVVITTMSFPLPRGHWSITNYMSLGWLASVKSILCNLRS